MNTRIKKYITSVALIGLTVASACADSVTGGITFTGGVSLDNNSDAGSSTKVLSWTGANGLGSPSVLSDSGSFAAFVNAGDTVSFFRPWMYNSGSINNFWTVDGFVFDLISSQIISETAGQGVVVSGTGTVTGPAGSGLDATPGTWTFTASDPSSGATDNGTPVFSFQGSTAVPDSASTLALLGGAISTLTLFRRKLAK